MWANLETLIHTSAHRHGRILRHSFMPILHIDVDAVCVTVTAQRSVSQYKSINRTL